MNVSFLQELYTAITTRGRQSPSAASSRQGNDAVVALSRSLLSSLGEASGMALASEIVTAHDAFDADERLRFFKLLKDEFGPDRERLEQAAARYVANIRAAGRASIAGSSRASASGTPAPTQSRLGKHGEARRNARGTLGVLSEKAGSSRGRCRLRSPFRLVVQSRLMGLHDRQAAASIRLRARAMPANQPWISALLRGSSDRFPVLSSA